MKVLLHTPISNRAWILPRFLEALAAQKLPPDIELRYLFDVNDTQDDSLVILRKFELTAKNRIRVHLWDRWSHLALVDHQWSSERYRRMIVLRNGALLDAKRQGADFLFSIDSDVILHDPHTLAHLIKAEVPVIAGVFMATWGNPRALALPNVWQCGQNDMTDEFLTTIATAQNHIPVGGLGACTLIRHDVWEAGITYSVIPNLSGIYRGEDRYFCLRAAVAGIPLMACAHTKIGHVDRS